MNAITKKTISYFERILWHDLSRPMCDYAAFRHMGTGIASENFSHHLWIRGYIL